MGLFKSAEERRIERDLEIRRGINAVKRNIRSLKRNEQGYVKKAKRAKKLGSMQQLQFLKNTIKRTAVQRKLMERQLLAIETAQQLKDQAEAHAQFAKSMQAVSKSISEMFDAADLTNTQRNYEKAITQAESMEQRMEIFLEMNEDSMSHYEGVSTEDLVSDDEIDAMLDEEIVAEEGEDLDKAIGEGLKEIEKELGMG